MEDPLEGIGTVHLGSFMQGHIHAGKSGQIDDCPPARVLPDAGRNVDGPEGGRLVDEINGLGSAQGLSDDVDQASVGRNKDSDHTAQHHHGDKVRSVNDGLSYPLKFLRPHLIDQQGKNNGDGKCPQDAVQTKQDRVTDHPEAVVIVEEPVEPFQPHPWASEESLDRVVIPKGDLHTVDGDILEDDGDNYRRKQQ